MAAGFAHLHVHSQYSLLDGAIRVKDLVKRVAAMGMGAAAVTDHGNMFGVLSFYKAAKDAGVQAILGAELEVAVPLGGGIRSVHLPLLAESLEGYQNIVWLVSRAHTHPDARVQGGTAVSWEDVTQHTRGVIALTGCMGGFVPQAILEEGEAGGTQALATLRDAFPAGNVYVELQDHGLPEQAVLNRILGQVASKSAIPTVATNCVHYPTKEDAEAHLYLSCIRTGRSYEEAKARHHGSSEMYLKSAEEMAHVFRHTPDAVTRTLEVAERTKVKLKLGEPMLPSFPVPDGFDTAAYFRHVAAKGLEERFGEFARTGKQVDKAAYAARLELELDVITKMKFPGYFLIVWDFIRYAKESGIPVGPGRGSGAGSLVAYALRITDLDPLPYNLLFERFLNPERISMPDFDVDFCMDRRDEVIAYVQRKYGEASVGQIATFAELKSKSVVKDVARCLGITPTEAQAIANLIPRKTPAETYTIGESLTIEPKLRARYDTEPRIKELLDQAQKLEGLTRHAGKHAAGIVISEGPLWDHVPIFKDEKSGALVTQYHKDDVEQAGLVKFDFLGLKTLTVLDIAVRLIRARPRAANGGVDTSAFDLGSLPLDDKETYRLLGSGETKGVFQLESSGMQQLFKDLRADCFEDIVAAVALYRPGPLGSGMVKDFVDRKNGRASIAKMHPRVDHILEPTYGVIVYQEQVMQIAQALSGYSLGGADLLRRAMGKKKPEEMAKQKSIFVDGAKAQGVDEKDAEHIFGLLEYFAGYGFNKSHSAAYALITYQTAYLKAHYPVELLCAILTSDKDRIDKVVRTIADARSMGVTVLPPDVNESETDFKVVYTHPLGDKFQSGKPPKSERVKDPFGPQIRFGLGAVRGLGESALEALFEARKEGGPFHDLFDLASRVDAKRVNKGVFEALVTCGALDTTLEKQDMSRARAFASIDTALERSRAASRDRERGQTSLFGLLDAGATAAVSVHSASFADAPPWDQRETLVREKQSLGFYVSGHPLDRYMKGESTLAKMGALPISELAQQADWSVVRVVGVAEGYRERIFKDGGGKIAFCDLEDLSGRVALKLRQNHIDQFGALLQAGEPVLVTAKVSFPRKDDDDDSDDSGPREPTLLPTEVVPLSDAIRADARTVVVRVREGNLPSDAFERMAALFGSAPGEVPVHLHIALRSGAEAHLALPRTSKIRVGDDVLSGLERIFGEQVAELR